MAENRGAIYDARMLSLTCKNDATWWFRTEGHHGNEGLPGIYEQSQGLTIGYELLSNYHAIWSREQTRRGYYRLLAVRSRTGRTHAYGAINVAEKRLP